MRKIVFHLLPGLMMVFCCFAVQAQEVELAADHPASQDLGRLKAKLKTLDYNKEKGKELSDYDVQSIRKYLDSCKEKAGDSDWSGYEAKVAGMEAYAAEAAAAENARKEQYKTLDAELDEFVEAISTVYSSRMVKDQIWESLVVSGAEYEGAARAINFERMLEVWEEIKTVNTSKRGDLKFSTYAGGNIDGFRAGYPDFVEVILLKKIDSKLEKSKNENRSIGLKSAMDALGYANGGLVLLPGHAGLSSRQAKARARVSEVGAALGTKYTGAFHKENIGRAFASNKDVNPGSASASDFANTFNSGDALYIYHFLMGPIGETTKSRVKKEGYDGFKGAMVNITLDGKTIFDGALASDLKDNRLSSTYKLIILPSEADLKSDWWSSLAQSALMVKNTEQAHEVSQSDYLGLFKAFGKQKAGQYDMVIRISNGTRSFGTGVGDELKMKYTLDPSRFKKLESQVSSDIVDAIRMYTPSGSDPAKEARVRQYISNRGTVLHVSRINDLSIREYYPETHDKYPGMHKRRTQAFQAAWKDKSGTCYFSLVSYDEIWEGKWVDKGFYARPTGIEIRCENVRK